MCTHCLQSRPMMLSRMVALSALVALGMADTPAQRAAALLQRMNITDKIGLLHGYPGPYVVSAMARRESSLETTFDLLFDCHDLAWSSLKFGIASGRRDS